jgi:hypothetical protein
MRHETWDMRVLVLVLVLVLTCALYERKRGQSFLFSTAKRREPKDQPNNLSSIFAGAPWGANSPAALHACGANYPSQERAISPAARTTLHHYPHQALKGGYFVFVWRVGTWLDLTMRHERAISGEGRRFSFLRPFSGFSSLFFSFSSPFLWVLKRRKV